jgi:hypothetical protein
VWEGLDRVRFFEVAARPEGAVGFAVVCVHWEDNDERMVPGPEGGLLCKLFRKWADAEACRRENEEIMQRVRAPDPTEGSDEPAPQFDTTRWTNEPFWPLGPPEGRHNENATFVSGDEAPNYEIVEVELPDGLSSWTAYTVGRVGWHVEPDTTLTFFATATVEDPPYGNEMQFVPLAAYSDRATAEARMRELELEAARIFNPFWRLGRLNVLTGLSLSSFIMQLAALVGPLPAEDVTNDAPNRRKWQQWWQEQMPTWPDEVRAKVWELFDAIRFHAVVEVDAR